MDRNTILAVTLCFLIFLGWQKFYQEPRMHPQSVQQSTPTVQSPSASTVLFNQESPLKKVKDSHPRPSKNVRISTGTGEAILGDGGYVFSGWQLKSYKLGLSPEAAAVDMHSVTHQEGEVSLAFDDPHLAYLNTVQGDLKATSEGAIWTYEDENVKLVREILSSQDKPYVEVQIHAEFKNRSPHYAFVSLGSQSPTDDPEAQDRQLIYWTNQSAERILLKDISQQKEISTPVKYAGATNRYFVMTAVVQGPLEPKGLIQPTGNQSARLSLVYPMSGNSIRIPLRVYFGPKELDLLRQVNPTLDHAVDFGWFTIFAYPLLKTLKWLYQFVQNYGIAIILLTVLLKIALYPLTYKSMKSMKKMAKLQPQLQKIREKHKDDREALNREMMTMMRSHGYNPMAGCLPMVIQMPIFFALYRVLYSSIELYHAPFTLWIHDLSSRDPFYVTPVLLSVTMFIQQKLTPNTATDPTQAKMMQLMPLIFGAFMLALPSGLTVYMLVNAIASIVQQMILNKKLDAVPAR
jgi:YidC/Oxa1 family membrane protein insertase